MFYAVVTVETPYVELGENQVDLRFPKHNVSASFQSSLSGYGRGGFGVNPPLCLVFYKSFITCAKEINCFRIILAG